MLSRGQRVGLLLRIAAKIEEDSEYNRHKIELMLRNFGMSTSRVSLEENLDTGEDDAVLELAKFLGVDESNEASPPQATRVTVKVAQPLFIFASHLTSERHFVGSISQELAQFGITVFVAHDSIPDDAAWQNEIDKALDHADAGLAFLHPDFKKSDWCPQEVGWLLGRDVPVMPLNFGITPFGPLGRLQANLERSTATDAVCEKIMERILRQEPLRAGLVASLVKAMQSSRSFNRTDRIWKYLRDLECDANQSAELLDATKSNDQIWRAESAIDGHQPYPRAIIDYLRRQPEAAAIKEDIDAYEAFLNDQEPPEDPQPL